MANEAQIRTSLQIRKGNTFYQSQPTSFQATVAGSRGPTPGAITVPVDGIDIDFSQLNQLGGFCRIQNLDATNFITYGVADPATGEFYPLHDLLPGESYVVRLSRYLGSRYPIMGTGTGTGTAGADVVMHVRADTAECQALVEAFDR